MPAIPTEKECSALALDVYRDADRPPLPEGYQLLCDCPKELQHDDYFGAAYYVVIDDRSVSVVIAHRGTKINFGNLIDDLLLALEIAPEAYELSSKPFTEYVINQANEKFPKGTRLSYVFTGHSLGSIHAELCMASKCELDEFSAITFESPGSKPIISE